MKTSIKMLLLALVITFSSAINANTEPNVKDPKSMTSEIQSLLENPSFVLQEDAFATVTLVLNRNSELVVISVESENEFVENFIKNRLNYKKMDVDAKDLNKTYVVPVKIKTE